MQSENFFEFSYFLLTTNPITFIIYLIQILYVRKGNIMKTLDLDFTKVKGKIKIMNAVNNGPSGSAVRGTGNIEAYRALEIPYARNHDASFYSPYGGEHTVDVHRIFKNFDADENDPKSYAFEATDGYVKNTFDVGTKVFYRLGASIEHGYKYGTYPPKDFAKWARICEHIIRHYTEGWADGFKYDIEYWEIWNEPECRNADGSNPCWQGTDEQFIDFYETAARYLKKTFPHLKIGGPAFCSSYMDSGLRKMFFEALAERKFPLDFYSFHGYLKDPSKVYALSDAATKAFADYGLPLPELIYNEWNYVREWRGEQYKYSRKMSKKLKGASLIAGAMAAGQRSDIDMLMYYDARPGAWCGIFDTDTLDPTKPYYTFYMFKELRRLGDYVETADPDEIFSCAASNGKDGAILLTAFNDDDDATIGELKLNVAGRKGRTRVEYYLLDEEHDAKLVREETFSSESFALYIDMKLYDTYLIKFVSV